MDGQTGRWTDGPIETEKNWMAQFMETGNSQDVHLAHNKLETRRVPRQEKAMSQLRARQTPSSPCKSSLEPAADWREQVTSIGL